MCSLYVFLLAVTSPGAHSTTTRRLQQRLWTLGAVTNNTAAMTAQYPKRPTMLATRLARVFPTFSGARVSVDDTTNTLSVLDVLAEVLRSKNTARSMWRRLFRMFPSCVYVKLPGRSKPTPMASFKTVLEIISVLPGRRAHEFRKPSSLYLARWLARQPVTDAKPLWRPWGEETKL